MAALKPSSSFRKQRALSSSSSSFRGRSSSFRGGASKPARSALASNSRFDAAAALASPAAATTTNAVLPELNAAKLRDSRVVHKVNLTEKQGIDDIETSWKRFKRTVTQMFGYQRPSSREQEAADLCVERQRRRSAPGATAFGLPADEIVARTRAASLSSAVLAPVDRPSSSAATAKRRNQLAVASGRNLAAWKLRAAAKKQEKILVKPAAA
eukprot:CAMPEP_0170139518 /NCGR_PEP_ID=MMETSP0033_2-20121228/5715_1 /TAXON_ID=195969 /ORGANISM="Dolichomastix tenuilepis, Strain CCMP3274" /LENGTH=211 /DNA_ID=CAMNT_0010375643 /DNA_START=103 /DNA_END=738 /DNA_ORIENTATION=+